MKKINNKGMTLIELLVSVVLISVIMIFMYKLIADVRAEKKENDKITDNILKMSEVEVEFYNRIFEELPKEVYEVRLWNDFWVDETQKQWYGHWVRIDFRETSGGTLHEYSIGVNKNGSGDIYMTLRKKVGGVHTNSDKYTFQGVKDVDIYEKCGRNGTDLICTIQFQMLDANKKNVHTLNYPIYWKTTKLLTDSVQGTPATSSYGTFLYNDRINERICTYKKSPATNPDGSINNWGTAHCDSFLNLTNSTSMEYKRRLSEIPRVNSLTHDINSRS